MTDNRPAIGRASSVNKRKSLLSELGIKAGAAGNETAPIPKPRSGTTATTTNPPTVNRRASVTIKPSSPSVSKSRTSSTATPPSTTRKAAPSPVKVDRSAKTSSLNSPTSPSPTTTKRRSIVPTSSTQRSSTISPLARRASVNHSPNASSTVNKRVSSPAGLESLQEVQAMKEQLSEQELLLKKREQEIQKLKDLELTLKSESEEKISALELDLKQLKENNEKVDIDDHESKQRALLEVAESKHKQEMEKVLEAQELKLQSELQTLSADYEQKISKLKQAYENQHQMELGKLDKEKKDYMQQLLQEQTLHESFKKEQEAVVQQLKEQITSMEEAQTSSHARKIENELAVVTAAFEEFKRSSQQTTENLERRYRDEIRQLQSGSDDTAQAWLEKTRSAQQEVDELHDELLRKEIDHKEAINILVGSHTEEMDQLTETCEKKEAELEAQSSQIEDLLYQVETLQNSLEAATVRLEHTAKSTPTTSSSPDDINASANGSPKHEPIKNIHQECLNRIDVKQKELDDLKSRFKEVKETHESQLNRLGQEKAELRKAINGLEQRLAATPPTTPTKASSSLVDEQRLINIAEQHRKEIHTMHEQYQAVVDTKDRELEDYAYRVKALVAAKQKEMEKLNNETNSTIDKYERDIEGYESKLIEYEKLSIKLQDRNTHWETLSKNNEALIEDMKKDCIAHRGENEQLIRLVNQLQSELHS